MGSHEPENTAVMSDEKQRVITVLDGQSIEQIKAKLKKDSEVHWYALRVTAQHERKLVDKLKEKDFVAFVPTRQEKHRWSDRMKIVEQVLTPQIVFVRNSMSNKNGVFVSHDVKSYVYAPGDNKPSMIPDAKMDDFIRLIDANFDFKLTLPFVGDTVMILEGPLKGLVGDLVKIDGDQQLVVRLNDAFGASVKVDALAIQKVPKGTVSIPSEHVPDRV